MKTIFSITLILSLILSCKTKSSGVNSLEIMQEDSPVVDMEHNSQNSLDWMGTYSGILPCADCMGIQTKIKVNTDQTIEITSIYIGKDFNGENSETITLPFEWEKDGNTFSYIQNGERQYFKVEENQLRFLDTDKQKIIGELEQSYLLKKGEAAILNKYWRATEIMGIKVEMNEGMKREPHLIFRFNGEFSGTGGCNSFFGKFQIEKKNWLKLEDIGRSEMECQFESYDESLYEALQMTQQFIMNGEDSMQLIVGKRAALAKFETVYLR
tara:strand:+ start:16134 stop:16940 length:807 start_codon:yes stop_codon:yes gene_type:complete